MLTEIDVIDYSNQLEKIAHVLHNQYDVTLQIKENLFILTFLTVISLALIMGILLMKE